MPGDEKIERVCLRTDCGVRFVTARGSGVWFCSDTCREWRFGKSSRETDEGMWLFTPEEEARWSTNLRRISAEERERQRLGKRLYNPEPFRKRGKRPGKPTLSVPKDPSPEDATGEE